MSRIKDESPQKKAMREIILTLSIVNLKRLSWLQNRIEKY